MKRTSFGKLLFAFMLVLVLALAACSGGDDENNTKGNDDGNTGTTEGNNNENNEDGDEVVIPTLDPPPFDVEEFNNIKTNVGEATGGGSLNVALVSDTVFEGTLHFNWYSDTFDAQILEWFDEGLLSWDADYVYNQEGAATYEVSEDNKTYTLTIRDEVNWHDGEPVTAEDLEFSYYVIADPEYDGDRFNSSVRNVEGIEEYHNGEADTISGLNVVDEKTIEITFENATPAIVTGGIWTYPMAKHIFGDIAVEDQAESDEVRKNPIGFGPYKVDVITPGESVTYTRNDDYWRGTPQLDDVTLRVVDPTVVANELESGNIDIAAFPSDQLADHYEMDNVEFLGVTDRAYTYIGFKLGTWNKEDGVVDYKPEESKVGDKRLRKAMWHAVDNNAVGDKFYHGLRWAGTTLIPPSHPEFHDTSLTGAQYDVDEANRLLDEAGFEWADGEDFRTDPDGNELVLNFASMSGGDTAEPIAQYYLQSWAAIGLNVQLLDGRLHEFNSFYEHVGDGGNDNPDVDVYMGAWGVGINADPSGLYASNASFNFPRWENEENDRLLAEGVSEEAFDIDYRTKVYKEWQELMIEEVPVFPTVYRAAISAANNRVVDYAIGDGTGMYRYEIGVTQDEPYVHGE